jgi:hypothetical protein
MCPSNISFPPLFSPFWEILEAIGEKGYIVEDKIVGRKVFALQLLAFVSFFLLPFLSLFSFFLSLGV